MESRNGKFREMIWINGKKVVGPFFPNKTLAREWLAKMQMERAKCQIHGDSYRPPSKMTLKIFAEGWYETYILPTKAPSTVRDYDRILRCHILPLLGHLPLRDVKTKEADHLVATLRKKGLSPKGTKDVLVLLKQLMNEAEKREEIPRNHLRHYKAPKVPERAFKYWSDSEISRFLLQVRSHDYYAFFVCAFYTGMRKGEIAALTWDCIDFQQSLITVKATLDKFGHRPSTKSGRIRHVPINDFLKGVLLAGFQARQVNSPYVFLIKGAPVDTNHLYRTFRQLQIAAGISNHIRFHDTRHTFASQFMMKGLGDLYVLSRILGHADTVMTQRYAHLSQHHLSTKTRGLVFGSEVELSKDFTPILPPANSESRGGDILLLDGST